jgi:hypothetical protein
MSKDSTTFVGLDVHRNPSPPRSARDRTRSSGTRMGWLSAGHAPCWSKPPGAYRYSPKVSAIIEKRAQQIDSQIRALAWKAQPRLSTRYRRLAARGKHYNVVVTAIARELGAFIWAAARIVNPSNP